MATITTRREQQTTAAAARKAGGYSELVRLSTEREQAVRQSAPKNGNRYPAATRGDGTSKRG